MDKQRNGIKIRRCPRFLPALLLCAVLAAACSTKKDAELSSKKRVTVSIPPQKFFVDRIAQGKITVNVMIPSDSSPVTYEPTLKQIKDLHTSAVYFLNGHLPFENTWVKKIRSMNKINKKIEFVDLSAQLDLIGPETKTKEEEHHADHDPHHEEDHGHGNREHHPDHDPHHEEDHGHGNREHHPDHDPHHEEEEMHGSGHHHAGHKHGIDPHVWMSPKEVQTQVKEISRVLGRIDPANSNFYASNSLAFIAELKELDREIRQRLAPLTKREFVVFHPALTYYARDYDLIEFTIEQDGKVPSPGQLKKIIDIIKTKELSLIFLQKGFDESAIAAIAKESGAKITTIHPLSLNWKEEILRITDHLSSRLN